MSLRADVTQLHSGALVASLYAGHGVYGANVVNGGDNGASIIAEATIVDPYKEYRLTAVSLPSGFILNEDGSGEDSPPSGVAVLKLFEDGVEL